MAEYEIFREQLAIMYPTYGHALWGPAPATPDKPVQIGDVGFVRSGRFHRLFNALLSADDQPDGCRVPEHHERLDPIWSASNSVADITLRLELAWSKKQTFMTPGNYDA
jgi:hypothetical protein